MLVGHQRKIAALKNFLEKGYFFSGFLFWGPEGIGKALVASEFAKGLLCEQQIFGGCGKCTVCQEAERTGVNRDLLVINQELAAKYQNEEIDFDPYGTEGVGKLIEFLFSSPTLAKQKVVLLDNAHQMSSAGQNRLLKTLENPPANSVIILVTHRPEALLATIHSRTLPICFTGVGVKELEKLLGSEAKLIARYSLNKPGRAVQLSRDKQKLSRLNKLVLALLSLEGQSLAHKLAVLEQVQKTFSAAKEEIFPLWQVVLRDELLLKLGLAQLTLLLTKERHTFELPSRLTALRLAEQLAETLAQSESEYTLRNCLERLSLQV